MARARANHDIEFLAHFSSLEDPRQQAKVLYPLDEILLVRAGNEYTPCVFYDVRYGRDDIGSRDESNQRRLHRWLRQKRNGYPRADSQQDARRGAWRRAPPPLESGPTPRTPV